MGWVRSGSCPPSVCQGRCCTHTGIWFTSPAAKDLDFLHLQQVRGMSVKALNDSYLLDLPQTCQYLTDSGLCSLHPSMNPSADLPTRPDFCEDWPIEPGQIVNDPYCGFSFTWADEKEVAIL